MPEQSTTDTAEFLTPLPAEGKARQVRSSAVQVDIGALSDPGKVRPNNEDHYLAARFDRSMQVLLTNLPPHNVPDRYGETAYGMLVADGMGGEAAGEIASSTAIRVLVDLVLGTPDWIMLYDEVRLQQVEARMTQRLEQVNEALAEQAQAEPELSRMGTTMTLTCSLGADLILAHVGDSRVYLFRQGKLHQRTHDHTLAQALADAGQIRPEQAATHRLRHVLTNALGPRMDKILVEIRRERLEDGDQVMLCTDGLTEMVPERAIEEVLRRPGPAAEACRALVDLALEAGGKDNVTVVLGRYRLPAQGV
jgi:serine/threonine protein phosphatase PrpC